MLLNELFKGTISLGVAFHNILDALRSPGSGAAVGLGVGGAGVHGVEEEKRIREGIRREVDAELVLHAGRKLVGEVFRSVEQNEVASVRRAKG